MNDRIVVVARIRPFVKSELANNDENVTTTMDGRHLRLSSSSPATATKNFTFDKVLDHAASQEETFIHIRPLLEYSLQGYNTSFFTYGQTGTGKTHTMLGLDLWNIAKEQGNIDNHIATDDCHIGIIPRSVRWLFDTLNSKPNIKAKVMVSYAELYNDKLLDLLSTDIPRPALEIREAARGQIFVPGLCQIEVGSLEQVLEVLWVGAKTRSVAATDMNDYSSRSHTIFQINLELLSRSNFRNDDGQVNSGELHLRKSKICLVDLAGSEKWKSFQLSTFSQERINELTSINKSLSALGNCINSLMKTNKGQHIPYRDSKLTRLLQDSLGGNAKTAFVVTISPSIRNFEETASTLQFADRAMKVQVFANVNKIVVEDGNAVHRYQQEINRLNVIVKILLRKCVDCGVDMTTISHEAAQASRCGGSDDLSGVGNNCLPDVIQLELHQMKSERDMLMKQLLHTQDTLRQSQDEKRKILEAIFEGESVAVDSTEGLERILFQRNGTDDNDEDDEDDECDDNLSGDNAVNYSDSADAVSTELAACSLLDSLEGMYPSSNADALIVGSPQDTAISRRANNNRAAVQFRVLQALREEVDRRREALVAADVAQEDRWCWLQQYHGWLQAQAQLRMQRQVQQDAISIDDASATDSRNDDIYDRVCLMETSVLLQTEEVERAKNYFLKTNSELLSKLELANKERDDHLLSIHQQQQAIKMLTEQVHELDAKAAQLQAKLQCFEEARPGLVPAVERPRRPIPPPPSNPPPPMPALGDSRNAMDNAVVADAFRARIPESNAGTGRATLPPPPPPSCPPPPLVNATQTPPLFKTTNAAILSMTSSASDRSRAIPNVDNAAGSDIKLLALVNSMANEAREVFVRDSGKPNTASSNKSRGTDVEESVSPLAMVDDADDSADDNHTSSLPTGTPSIQRHRRSGIRVVPTATASTPRVSTDRRQSLVIAGNDSNESKPTTTKVNNPTRRATIGETTSQNKSTRGGRLPIAENGLKSKSDSKTDAAKSISVPAAAAATISTSSTSLKPIRGVTGIGATASKSKAAEIQLPKKQNVVNGDVQSSSSSSAVKDSTLMKPIAFAAEPIPNNHSQKGNSQAELLAMAEEILNRHKSKFVSPDKTLATRMDTTERPQESFEEDTIFQMSSDRYDNREDIDDNDEDAIAVGSASDHRVNENPLFRQTMRLLPADDRIETDRMECGASEPNANCLDDIDFLSAVTPSSLEINVTTSRNGNEDEDSPQLSIHSYSNSTLSTKATSKPKKAKPLWRSAVDPASGKTYYYNKATGITTWDQPSEEELQKIYVS